MKAFADDKVNIAKMMISLYNRVENIVGKGEKCWLPAFSPFPTMFSKSFFYRVVESWDCIVKSLPFHCPFMKPRNPFIFMFNVSIDYSVICIIQQFQTRTL